MYKYIVCARLWIAELREAEGNLIVSGREKAMEAGRALSLSHSLLILLEEGRHSQGCHQHCDTGVKLHATTLSLSLVSLHNPPLTIPDMSVALCIVTNVTRNTGQ